MTDQRKSDLANASNGNTVKSITYASQILNRPLLLSGISWTLVPLTYLAVGILTYAEIDPLLAFFIAAPLGIAAVACWILAIGNALRIIATDRRAWSVACAMLAIPSAILPIVLMLIGLTSSE